MGTKTLRAKVKPKSEGTITMLRTRSSRSPASVKCGFSCKVPSTKPRHSPSLCTQLQCFDYMGVCCSSSGHFVPFVLRFHRWLHFFDWTNRKKSKNRFLAKKFTLVPIFPSWLALEKRKLLKFWLSKCFSDRIGWTLLVKSIYDKWAKNYFSFFTP